MRVCGAVGDERAMDAVGLKIHPLNQERVDSVRKAATSSASPLRSEFGSPRCCAMFEVCEMLLGHAGEDADFVITTVTHDCDAQPARPHQRVITGIHPELETMRVTSAKVAKAGAVGDVGGVAAAGCSDSDDDFANIAPARPVAPPRPAAMGGGIMLEDEGMQELVELHGGLDETLDGVAEEVDGESEEAEDVEPSCSDMSTEEELELEGPAPPPAVPEELLPADPAADRWKREQQAVGVCEVDDYIHIREGPGHYSRKCGRLIVVHNLHAIYLRAVCCCHTIGSSASSSAPSSAKGKADNACNVFLRSDERFWETYSMLLKWLRDSEVSRDEHARAAQGVYEFWKKKSAT